MLKYDTLNELTFQTCNLLLSQGNRMPSRNGMTYELCDTEIILKNPQNRHLYLEGRKSNLYACLGEIFWIMNGESTLSPLMTTILPRCTDFSDDGKTWQNGYGPKLYAHGNLDNVIQSFKLDGKNTRRACMAIWTPETDTIKSLEKQGITKPKDVSCNNFLWFWIRDNKLNLKVGIRSNDVLWGLSAINVPEWTFLQEIVLRILKNMDPTVFGDVELGYYHHSVISLHVYDETIKQAEDLVANKSINEKRFDSVRNDNINIGILGETFDVERLFSAIYESFCCRIVDEPEYHNIDTVFSEWNIPKKENQLYQYAKLVEEYINHKLDKPSSFDLSILSPDLKAAVLSNKFTPKSWL